MINLPGLQIKLFGFEVTIGLDFLLLVLIFSTAQGLSGPQLVAWVLILAFSILAHELGHAFALRRYGITPTIRLWMMGGMTLSGFAITPRRQFIVSAAGPAVGIAIGLVFLVAARALFPNGFLYGDLLGFVVVNLVWVNLFWGAFNLLPIAALDGGNIVTSGFLWAFGERGRVPAMIFVGLASVVVALVALLIGFWYLALIVFIFSFLNPAPYLELWRIVSGGPRAGVPSGSAGRGSGGSKGSGGGSGGSASPRAASGPRPAVAVAMSARRQYAETYVATLASRAGYVDLDEVEQAPAPLLSDISGMITRRDDAGLAARLISENDPVAALGIVARLVDGKRVDGVLGQLKKSNDPGRETALLKLQVGLHSIGQFQESIAAAGALGSSGDAQSALLVARSGGRLGDRKLTEQALTRVVALRSASGATAGVPFEGLTDTALGDIARMGADAKVAELLDRLRGYATN